jgi:hypothetical protein
VPSIENQVKFNHMKTIVQVICFVLLLVNGLGAVYGGFLLMVDPSGSKMQMPLSYLEHSPFSNYLIPGIILFIVNGLFSFVTIMTILFKNVHYYWFVIMQGLLLSGWILFQIILLRIFYAPLHATFLIIGLCLIGCGLYQMKHK